MSNVNKLKRVIQDQNKETEMHNFILIDRCIQHLQSSKARKWVWPKRKSVKVGVAKAKSQAIKSNCSADQVTKKRPPSYFDFATWTSDFILHFYNALDVSSPKWS